MEPEYSAILSESLRGRVSSTYSLDAEITRKDAESSVGNSERFLTATHKALELEPE